MCERSMHLKAKILKIDKKVLYLCWLYKGPKHHQADRRPNLPILK